MTLPNEDYIATWPDGSQGTEWTIPEDLQATDAEGNLLWDAEGNPIWQYNGGQICVVEDPYGCGVTEHCALLFIGAAPTVNPTIDGIQVEFVDEPLIMCPEIPYDFDLNEIQPGPPYNDFAWWTECGGENYYFGVGGEGGGAVTLASWQFPEDCWGNIITINGLVETPCGNASMEHEIIIEQCEVNPPNVFTPRNGDATNIAFIIPGLDNYDGVLLRVFDRWGNKVYEDLNYSNINRAEKMKRHTLSEGTYYFLFT